MMFRPARLSLMGILPITALMACGSDLPDVTFENVRTESISDTSAMIRFTTNIETTCEAEYGLSADMLIETATDPNMDPSDPYSITHEVPLGSLLPETVYFWRARAEDRNGNVFYSDVFSFETLSDLNPGMMNVAMMTNGTSVMDVSSNFAGAPNNGSFGINHALDGDPSTEWSSNGDGDNAFVELDLGQMRTVSQFRYQSRKMLDGSSIVTKVQLTWNGGTMTAGPFDTPDPDTMYTFALTPAITTQTIRVEAVETTGGNTGAKEIQLWMPMP